jgi:hypothetical protein
MEKKTNIKKVQEQKKKETNTPWRRTSCLVYPQCGIHQCWHGGTLMEGEGEEQLSVLDVCLLLPCLGVAPQ